MTFEKALATTNSAAQATLIDAMVEWWMATDRQDAIAQITTNPGQDLAGIKNSTVSGLTCLAAALYCNPETLISETDLGVLSMVSPEMIVESLHAIHTKWIEDNFTPRRWAEKYFKGQLPQYRKTAKISWTEVSKDLLFIAEYLQAGNAQVTDNEIQSAFIKFAEYDSSDDDLAGIRRKAMSFAPDIIQWIKKFRDGLDPVKKASMIDTINQFLDDHSDPIEIVEIMIAAVVA